MLETEIALVTGAISGLADTMDLLQRAPWRATPDQIVGVIGKR